MIPVASATSLSRFVDGQIIEGVGVEPDETVEYFVPYSAGQDRLLNYAVKRAVESAETGRN
jgi:C-terminal processing protease CtpA/Prc